MKRILMIGTGGTIASMITAEGLHPQLTLDEILSYIPDVAKFCEVAGRYPGWSSDSIHPGGEAACPLFLPNRSSVN